MAATSLFLTRDALHGLLFTALGGVGVELLPAPPSEAEDLTLGVACWWSNDVSVAAEPYTLPSGLLEQYTHTLVVQSIPEDGDVSVSAAQAEAMEIVDLVYATVRANRRLLDPDVVGWEARCQWAGFEHAAARLEQPAGYATRFELRIQVEATRCS